MSDLIKQIDEKTRLAGANKLEVLTFSLGVNPVTSREETFGINVFKVREVIKTPPITTAPGMIPAVKGMVSLRGNLIPVIDLAEYIGIGTDDSRDVLILTEYNGKTQGFLVKSVDTILRISWEEMRVPPAMIAGNLSGLVTAVTELKNGTLVMMLDVEKLLSELSPNDAEELAFNAIQPITTTKMVYFTDDSSVARKQIQKTLTALNVSFAFAQNGGEAYAELMKIADSAISANKKVSDIIGLILTDVEMPEMDGYTLTKKIKADSRFSGIPIIMHSSLSGNQNQSLGKSVGVDEYVSKFEPHRLSETIKRKLID